MNRPTPEILSNIQVKAKKNSKIIRLFVLIFWIASFGIIIFNGWKNFDSIKPYFQNIHYTFVIPVFFLYLISILFACFGWSSIIYSLDKTVNYWVHIQIFLVTLAARRLPGTLWYVGGRMIVYEKIGIKKTAVVIASTIEMILMISTGSIIGLILLLLTSFELAYIYLAIIVVLVIVGVILLHPSVLTIMIKYTRLNPLEKFSFKQICSWFIYYLIMWGTSGLMLFYLIEMFKNIEWQNLFFIIGAWSLSGAVGLLTIFLPSSFGVTEITIATFLAPLLSLPLSGTIAIATRLFTIVSEVILAIIFYPFIHKLPVNSIIRQQLNIQQQYFDK